MQSELAILGMGTVSALGGGAEALLAALRGRARPRLEVQTVQTARGPVEVPVLTADPEGLERFIARRALRRVDRFARMALLASFLAFEDAGLTPPADGRGGLVFGTGYGPLQTTFEFLDTAIADGDRGASPTAFAGSVHNAPAAQVSIALKLDGPCQTVTTFDRTAAGVLRTAQAWLAEGAADLVLAGLGDEFHAVGAYALAATEANLDLELMPLDTSLCTWRPGEMFTALLLGRAGERPARYGTIEAIDVLDRDFARARELLGPHEAAILGACGRRGDFIYERLRLPGMRYAVYTPYYGGAPTSLGMDLAAAALSLREGVLYPAPESVCRSRHWNLPREPQPLRAGAGLACVDCNADGACTIVSLWRGAK